MRYLLVNHIPIGRGTAQGSYVFGDMWLEDLRAQADALAGAGMRLTLAAPLVDQLDPMSGGSFNNTQVVPSERGFDFFPLPFYQSARQYFRVRKRLRRELANAISTADIVQCGYGGHPFPLGRVAWPIAGKLGKARIWVFDGGDPFPQWRVHAEGDNNRVRRAIKLLYLRGFEFFCAKAIRKSDLVFAHNNSVFQRFQNVWNDHCHRFDRSFVTESILADDEELARRRETLLDTTGPLRLVASGRQIAIKGTDHLLRAMKQAIDAGANLRLDVLGDGDDLPRYRALCTELGLDGVVRFLGSVPYGKPLFDAWNDQDVTVVTNLTDEFSRNLLLSMARGMPVITYSNPGDGMLEAQQAAIIVPRGDIAALASALAAAAKDRQRLVQLSEVGLRLAREKTLDACHRKRAELAAQVGRAAAATRPLVPA